jgi:hypothetical protein
MADQLQLRGGTTAETATFTGALREVTVDTDKDTLVVHDNALAGGYPLMREDFSNSALALGSASTPSLKFTGDTDTGIYSPGADQVAVATNGVERVEFGTSEVVFNDGGANYDFRIEGDTNANLFFVDASAEAVGIGSASFNGRLAVAENSAGLGIQFLSADSNSAGYIGTTNEASTANGIEINSNRGSGKIVLKTNAAEAARIDSSGRLLIGTSSSSEDSLLKVEGNVANGTTTGAISLSRGSLPSGTSAGLGSINFTDNSGNQGAQIIAISDGTWT